MALLRALLTRKHTVCDTCATALPALPVDRRFCSEACADDAWAAAQW